MVTPASPIVQYHINPRFVPDDIPIWLGNNKDSALIFDNANNEWTVQTKNVAGTLTDRLRIKANTDTPSADLVDNPLKWTAGRAVTAADYSIGRDLDATNQLHLNVPTGATFELSVNDTAEFVLSATQVDLRSNDLIGVNSATITGATGNTLVVDTNVLVVDATNNRVGVRIATPATFVDTHMDAAFTNFALVSDAFRIQNNNVTPNTFAPLQFITENGLFVSYIAGIAGRLQFYTNGETFRAAIDASGNFGLGTASEFGGGAKTVGLQNAVTVPATNPVGGGVLYAEAGALKWRGSGGTITTIAAA